MLTSLRERSLSPPSFFGLVTFFQFNKCILLLKAYDKLKWGFVEGMLRCLGFCDRWISLIMECVTSLKFKVQFENDLLGPIVPCMGLGQRDPLLAYLFIICAEGVSSLLRKNELAGDLHGIKVARHAPIVSHLFFAYDSFLFRKANSNMAKCRHLKELLAHYKQAWAKALFWGSLRFTIEEIF